jgi:hypothetical protein
MNIEKNTNDIYQEILNELIVELLNSQESNAAPELIDLIHFRISDQILRMNGYAMDDYGKYYFKSN